ncbi:ABC transporter substrate-binding protein [Paracoccus suum]|uniref:ABC transporter substrate-binding protein n=2 Tax=Paracoccus suum TaxID=2259340 RepID=A0A344PMI3_9RHOB|nr:ABC transporter substrate-binding protein [Paracoccus suum]
MLPLWRAGMLALGVSALAVGAACAKELTIGMTSDASVVDPQAGEELNSTILFYHIYDPLVRRTADLKFVPGLAESWEIVDPTTWRFKLRPGVKFHNGEDFKASDVVFTFNRLKDTNMAELGANVASVMAVDDHTVEIKTPSPFATLPNKLAEILILSEKNAGAGPDAETASPLGTGPYKLEDWAKEDHITLEAFPEYWGGKPKIDTVTLRPITNPATRTAALLTGELDLVIDLPVRDVDRVKGENGFSVVEVPSLNNMVLALDFRDKSPTIPLETNPLKDQRVRAAMAQAIDIETIRKVIMNGFSTPSDQFVPEGSVGYLPDADFHKMYPYDPEKAKALLAEAGVGDGFEITLDATNNRYVNDAQIAQAMASMLGKVGIKVNLNLMPKSNFWGYIRNPSEKSSFIMSGWNVPSADAGAMYQTLYYSRDNDKGYGQVNRGSYSNPELDKLVDAANATADVAERDRILKDATALLLKDIPMIPLHYEQDIYGVRDGVTFEPRRDKYVWAFEMDVAE